MGGTIGFFLGASLLSIAELFYYFCIRKMVDQDKLPDHAKLEQQIIKLMMRNHTETKQILVKPKNVPKQFLY